VRESLEARAARDTGGLGSRPPLLSILGKFEWVRKVGQSDVEEAELVTSPLEVYESGLGLGFAARGVYEVGSSSQTVPTVESGHSDQLGETGVSTEHAIELFGVHEVSRNASEGAEQSTESSQSLLGGFAIEMATHTVAQVSGLVPWLSEGSVLDNIVSRGHDVEELNIGALDMRVEGVESLSLPIQNQLSGLEMVPYGDGEPIPLDWSQAMEVVGGDGTQETGKEVELIMAFS
jgi:hypothetical protein